jgi:hypothetical protein
MDKVDQVEETTEEWENLEIEEVKKKEQKEHTLTESVDFGATKALLVKDFPSAFKTIDIIAIFKETPRIKWIDDTSCLAIFRDPAMAKIEYINTCTHPFIKISPYREPMRSVGPRPQTTDMVARRLIAGALGMKPLQKSLREIESDALKLEQAKGRHS